MSVVMLRVCSVHIFVVGEGREGGIGAVGAWEGKGDCLTNKV